MAALVAEVDADAPFESVFADFDLAAPPSQRLVLALVCRGAPPATILEALGPADDAGEAAARAAVAERVRGMDGDLRYDGVLTYRAYGDGRPGGRVAVAPFDGRRAALLARADCEPAAAPAVAAGGSWVLRAAGDGAQRLLDDARDFECLAYADRDGGFVGARADAPPPARRPRSTKVDARAPRARATRPEIGRAGFASTSTERARASESGRDVPRRRPIRAQVGTRAVRWRLLDAGLAPGGDAARLFDDLRARAAELDWDGAPFSFDGANALLAGDFPPAVVAGLPDDVGHCADADPEAVYDAFLDRRSAQASEDMAALAALLEAELVALKGN